MSISDVHKDLMSHWVQMESQWQTTRAEWRDAVAVRFEKTFWTELQEGMPRFLRDLEEVNETLDRALQSLSRY